MTNTQETGNEVLIYGIPYDNDLTAIPKNEKLADPAALKTLGFDILKEDEHNYYISSRPVINNDLDWPTASSLANTFDFKLIVNKNEQFLIYPGDFFKYTEDRITQVFEKSSTMKPSQILDELFKNF